MSYQELLLKEENEKVCWQLLHLRLAVDCLDLRGWDQLAVVQCAHHQVLTAIVPQAMEGFHRQDRKLEASTTITTTATLN
nr:unnamed protein product [Callosobruchus analis]